MPFKTKQNKLKLGKKYRKIWVQMFKEERAYKSMQKHVDSGKSVWG